MKKFNQNFSGTWADLGTGCGAIALGHPLGMTGARIIQTAALELKRTNEQYALISMCVGVGQGYAVIIERI